MTEPDDGPYRVESIQFADKRDADALLEGILKKLDVRETVLTVREVDHAE